MPQFLTVSALLSLSTSKAFGAQRLAVVRFGNVDLILIQSFQFDVSCSEEVVQGGIAVKRVFAGGMNLASGFLQTTTRLAFHVGIGLKRNIWISC